MIQESDQLKGAQGYRARSPSATQFQGSGAEIRASLSSGGHLGHDGREALGEPQALVRLVELRGAARDERLEVLPVLRELRARSAQGRTV